MKVYLVIKEYEYSDDYDGSSEVLGLFYSKDKAEEVAIKERKTYPGYGCPFRVNTEEIEIQ